MKIGIFPGSFNPVHIGHLAIANYIAEFEGYDQIWFLITPQNPLKKKKDLLDQNLRLELIEEAIEGYEKFKTCTIEWDMPQPSYTINTLQKLRMMHPGDSFDLIIGSDNWANIHRWKDYQMILIEKGYTGIYERARLPNEAGCADQKRIARREGTLRKRPAHPGDRGGNPNQGRREGACGGGGCDDHHPPRAQGPPLWRKGRRTK